MNVIKSLKVMATIAATVAALGMAEQASAVTYAEVGGVVVGEAEIFTNRIGSANDSWTVVPNESAGAGPAIANARGGAYIQSLPDDLTPGGPNVPPEIHYNIQINTPGTYRLFLRWDGNNTNGTTRGQSDSIFADIIQMKDGGGGSIADWYEFTDSVNGNFASPAWDGGAGFEQNAAAAANNPALWTLTPGYYDLRITMREDGSAVDAWVLQLENLAAPSGNGPATSPIIPEPATAMLGLIGLAGLARRRRAHA